MLNGKTVIWKMANMCLMHRNLQEVHQQLRIMNGVWKIWDDICISDLIPEDWEKSDEIKSAETLFQGLLSKALVEGLSSLGVKKNIGLAITSNYGGDIGFVVMIFFGVHKATFEFMKPTWR